MTWLPGLFAQKRNENEPDYTTLAEELFNQFKFNCDIGDEDCDQIRESFGGQLDQIYQDVQSRVNNLKFETVYTATVDGKAPNLTGEFLGLRNILCEIPYARAILSRLYFHV